MSDDGAQRLAFLDELRGFEGRRVGPPEPGPDAVNEAMIRHWCEAMGDRNPVYTDADAASRSAHGSLVAPPVMLQAWVMRGLAPRPATGGSAQDALMRLLDSAGFTSVVATNCEQEYVRYLRPGDRVSAETTIESVSEEKSTGLGVGHFVTTRSTYRDQAGGVVASHLFRVLKFRPRAQEAERARGEERPRPRRPRPSVTRDNAFFFDGARKGMLLVQRCSSCGRLRHPPGPMCPDCHSLDWEPIEASGRGVVYSWVVNHHPKVPAFDYPLVVALVELEEGTRLVSNLIGVEPGAVRIGMPVEVEMVAFDDELTLPQFRPSGTAAARP